VLGETYPATEGDSVLYGVLFPGLILMSHPKSLFNITGFQYRNLKIRGFFMIEYSAGSVKAQGELLLPKGKGPFPTLILIPYWKGKDHVGREYAKRIVSTYPWAVFLADYYGEGRTPKSAEEAGAWAGALFEDRQELRNRMKGAVEAAKKQKEVDPNKVGAIGFCFGGLAAIELFKMGLPLKGVATFHATLGYKMGDKIGEKLALAKGIKSSLLVMHGFLDPLVSLENRLEFEKEMKEADVDWQMHLFGRASHAFTNPESNDPKGGLMYDRLTDERSFKMMGLFFSEIFA